MKRALMVLFVTLLVAFTLNTIHHVNHSNELQHFEKIQLKNTQLQLKNLETDVIKLEKDTSKSQKEKDEEIERLKQRENDLQSQLEARRLLKAQEAKTYASSPPAASTAAYSVPGDEAKAFIYGHESGNCPTKWQGEVGGCPAYHGVPTDSNTGYGLCQSTPASKMAIMGAGWETSYELQDAWCTQYANRYGGWAGSYAAWLRQGWW